MPCITLYKSPPLQYSSKMCTVVSEIPTATHRHNSRERRALHGILTALFVLEACEEPHDVGVAESRVNVDLSDELMLHVVLLHGNDGSETHRDLAELPPVAHLDLLLEHNLHGQNALLFLHSHQVYVACAARRVCDRVSTCQPLAACSAQQLTEFSAAQWASDLKIVDRELLLLLRGTSRRC